MQRISHSSGEFQITKIPTTYDKLEMVLTDRQAQQSYSEEREPLNGAAYFDVRRYLQLLFNNVAQGVIDYSKAFVDSPLKRISTLRYTGIATAVNSISARLG